MQICRTYLGKQFRIVTFFRNLYSLTEKWIFIINKYNIINRGKSMMSTLQRYIKLHGKLDKM